jgi:hypothetical protein
MTHPHDVDEDEPATPGQLADLERLGMRPSSAVGRRAAEAMIGRVTATLPQRQLLARLGVGHDPLISRHGASALITNALRGRDRLPPSWKQEQLLRRLGKWREGLTRGEASALIGELTGRP